MSFDPSSFRDPDARVLAGGGPDVLRALSQDAATLDARLRRAGVLAELERDGLLIASQRRDDQLAPQGWSAVLSAPRLPFVSYPYEWSFSMLQDAALLTLDLQARLLSHAATLKDASAFNVLFDGARPVFVDLGSLAERAGNAPWGAYGQFGDHFLAPLMLEAYRGIPFQPLWRGNLEGLPVRQLAPMLAPFGLLRGGVLTHVMLRAWLERRTQHLSVDARREVRAAPLAPQAVARNVAGLRALIAGLRSGASSAWATYDETNSYDPAAAERKMAFVRDACARLGGGRQAWDWGANTGRYSRLLAEHYATVVAMDADAGAVDRLYTSLRGTDAARRILPLVMDAMDPSPARGWRGTERLALAERGRPELVLSLALIHHLCLGRGVPLDQFLDFALQDAPHAVVEFIAAEDPMAQALLATKTVTHPGYDAAAFRHLAAQRGRVVAEAALSPTRQLLLLAR
ncbi:MAG: methyltransferase [Deltaproteobacteria bacterium]|nr:methyltransferase [Deltaproteobacteria bacterium]